MSERPTVLFGFLLAAAAVVAALIGSGLVALGMSGALGIAGTLAGASTACIFFVAELDRIPLSSLLLVALALASAIGFARRLVSYLRQQRLLRALPLERIEDGHVLEVARSAGISRLYRIPAGRPAAFCFGLFRPRVVLTSGLLARLDAAEQAAVIWHEACHARSREPLRCLLGSLASSSFFWLPALRDLLDRFSLAKELAADRLAVSRTSPRALAGALYEVAGSPASGAAVGAGDLAAARVDRIFEPEAPLPPLFRRTRLGTSALSAAVFGLVLSFPAQLDLRGAGQLRSMLTAGSVHGLPGMAAGLAVNALILACFSFCARRLLRRRLRQAG